MQERFIRSIMFHKFSQIKRYVSRQLTSSHVPHKARLFRHTRETPSDSS